jgi:hypothetical protein
MAAALPRAGNRCWVSFRTLWIPNRCDHAWVLIGANHKTVGSGGGRIRQATALDRLTVSRWGKARTAIECGSPCSVKALTTSSVEKLAACWSRTMTTDMNASEDITWVVVCVSVVLLFVCM